ncbi:hypothetical protein ACFLXT_01575 [Chloroflexota bacterium]
MVSPTFELVWSSPMQPGTEIYLGLNCTILKQTSAVPKRTVSSPSHEARGPGINQHDNPLPGGGGIGVDDGLGGAGGDGLSL